MRKQDLSGHNTTAYTTAGYSTTDHYTTTVHDAANYERANPKPSDSAPSRIGRDAVIGAQEGARILVIDAEPSFCELLRLSFHQIGHTVTAAYSAKAALHLLQSQEFELIVVDVLLPDMDGFKLVSLVRAISDVPIMVLSALARPDEIVRALDLGADGYIAKPVIFTELLAKVRALLRRIYQFNSSSRRQVIVRGDVRLDCAERSLTIGGRCVHLSVTEYRLIHYLLARPNQVVCKQELLRQVWGYPGSEASNVVELAIGRLRRKIEADPTAPCRLITIRAAGYQLRFPNVGQATDLWENARRIAEPVKPAHALASPFAPRSMNWLPAA
jgi:DNA-binding response OmpR family regulator